MSSSNFGGGAQNTLVAVIPAHDEEATIESVVTSLRSVVDRVFVVDDGSTDSTGSRALDAGAEVITHEQNLGVGIALQTGYDMALASDTELLVQLDADGQHGPEHVRDLLAALDDSTDIIIGSRFVGDAPDGYGLVRRFGIYFFSFLCSVLGGNRIYDVTSGFRLYRLSALSRLPPVRSRHWAAEQTLMAMRLGMKIKEVSVPIPPRTAGRSQFEPFIAALYPVRVLAGMLGAIRKTSRIGGMSRVNENR